MEVAPFLAREFGTPAESGEAPRGLLVDLEIGAGPDHCSKIWMNARAHERELTACAGEGARRAKRLDQSSTSSTSGT